MSLDRETALAVFDALCEANFSVQVTAGHSHRFHRADEAGWGVSLPTLDGASIRELLNLLDDNFEGLDVRLSSFRGGVEIVKVDPMRAALKGPIR